MGVTLSGVHPNARRHGDLGRATCFHLRQRRAIREAAGAGAGTSVYIDTLFVSPRDRVCAADHRGLVATFCGVSDGAALEYGDCWRGRVGPAMLTATEHDAGLGNHFAAIGAVLLCLHDDYCGSLLYHRSETNIALSSTPVIPTPSLAADIPAQAGV